jgi:hypothetical protein
MPEVLIVVESRQADITELVVSALKQAIWVQSASQIEIQTLVLTDGIEEQNLGNVRLRESLVYPLTLNLPNWLEFPGQTVYRACRDVSGLRQRLEQWQYLTGMGNFWLPIVLTAKGPLYAEVVGAEDIGVGMSLLQTTDTLSRRYLQPIHFPDVWRQSLYELGYRLLRSLAAPPAVYLLQFGFQNQTLCFDRLFPFPAAPAIASLGVQVPDLFTCHWLCMLGKPIHDLIVRSSA